MDHIPDKGQVLQRYYGYYANRTRGVRRKAQEAKDAMRVADVADVADEVADVMRTDAELPPGGVTRESPGGVPILSKDVSLAEPTSYAGSTRSTRCCAPSAAERCG